MMSITDQIREVFTKCQDFESRVVLLNEIRAVLRECSPFEEPVEYVHWVKAEKVQANAYNPNAVASPEMQLLYESIKTDGYTQPIVVYALANGKYEIVDGFHRNRIGREYPDIRDRVNGYLPVVIIDKPLDERIGSTIRHNRARGTHQIRSMSDIVVELVKLGWDDSKICQKLGMDREEVLRLKQISGLREAFMNHRFSQSWDEFERVHFQNEVGVVAKTVSKKPLRQ